MEPGRQFVGYHSSPEENRASISEHGLRGAPDEQDPHASGGVWMFSDRSRIKNSPHTDVWKVTNPPGVEHGSVASAEWHPSDPVHVTFDHVPPKHLELER